MSHKYSIIVVIIMTIYNNYKILLGDCILFILFIIFYVTSITIQQNISNTTEEFNSIFERLIL